LIALYLTEPSSRSVRAFVEERDKPLLLNELQELEFKNGLRQKVLRKEITEPELVRSLRVFEDDCVAEKIQRKPVLWPAVYLRAETLSRRFSVKQICRSFDLLHVAIAVASKVRHFATLDVEQAKLARVAGLKPVKFPPASEPVL
jgi:hypothetical protein